MWKRTICAAAGSLQSHQQLMFARADGAHSADKKEIAAEQVSAVSAARWTVAQWTAMVH